MIHASSGRFWPSRRRGQNFLIDGGIQRRIVEAAAVPADATVVEIGAGTGNLSQALLDEGLRVVAIEVERELVRRLRDRFDGSQAIEIVHADARRVDLAQLAGGDYHLIANLPYSVGTRIVIDLLHAPAPPLSLTTLVQREVAHRMVAAPGRMSLLSVIVQSLAVVRRLFDVPPAAFRPRPKVTSSLVRLETAEADARTRAPALRRIAVARHGFAQPRKMLSNSLAAGLRTDARTVAEALTVAGIEPSRRAGSLSLSEWDATARALHVAPPAPAHAAAGANAT